MNQTYQLKYERLKLNEPVTQEEIDSVFTKKEKDSIMRIYNDYVVGGQNRKKYMERIEIEFPKMTREKYEMIDAYIEHKRWLRVQSKALFRDWERDKLDLKQRTIKSIEEEIKDTEERIAKELEFMKQEALVTKLHKNRDEKRVEYEAKLKVIREIEEEKKLEAALTKEKKEQEYLEHCKEIKNLAEAYKEDKQKQSEEEIEKQRLESQKREAELRKRLQEIRPRVEEIREQEEQKAKQKYEMLEEKRHYLQNREERINKAVEEYSIRPQVERDADRVTKETVAKTLSKNVKMDKADKVELFKNPGFTVDNLMKDIRFKVGAALSNAGLSTTAYAKTLMSGLQGNLHQRRDMTSNNF